MSQLSTDFQRDGVVTTGQLLSLEEVEAIRIEIGRYIRHELESRPSDAATREADGVTVRNLWRLEQHHPRLGELAKVEQISKLVAPLLGGTPVLCGIETFNKPARIGSGVPYHQDNA